LEPDRPGTAATRAASAHQPPPVPGYLLKEALADILGRRQVQLVPESLLEWISWASRSWLLEFKKVAATIKKYFDAVLAPGRADRGTEIYRSLTG
jgi:transposase